MRREGLMNVSCCALLQTLMPMQTPLPLSEGTSQRGRWAPDNLSVVSSTNYALFRTNITKHIVSYSQPLTTAER